MLKCRQATRLMSESQERPLTTRETLSLRLHTLMCDACSNFQQQLPVLRRLCRTYAKRK
ncbi:zf-HC2 domain-containing protein [Oceanimonas pelagia]|uniref:Zf-HC2 domain-containing protein n=1 Tax=Oceanimonas pelagia TaxID=3028314 RepID=A0AA50QC78_9GAMM|nr:zf-HC2 domain-containing protein [Oceanimonas pelagia]WMC10869.1 zf-HC2 domain-containing protein [Oceanimonas pelagia]